MGVGVLCSPSPPPSCAAQPIAPTERMRVLTFVSPLKGTMGSLSTTRTNRPRCASGAPRGRRSCLPDTFPTWRTTSRVRSALPVRSSLRPPSLPPSSRPDLVSSFLYGVIHLSVFSLALLFNCGVLLLPTRARACACCLSPLFMTFLPHLRK